MNVVIVDSESDSSCFLKKQLEQYNQFNVKKMFENSSEALSYLLLNECDVLFVDANMPNVSGVYVAQKAKIIHPNIKICFISERSEYAVMAFDLNAIDYIIKPYSEERLKECIKRVLADDIGVNMTHRIVNKIDMLCAYDGDDIVLIKFEDIFYFETVNGKVYIHTKDKVYRSNKNLTFYEQKLTRYSFFKTHKCYIANLSKVTKFSPRINYTYDMFFNEIKDIIPVSRGKVKELKSFLNNF